jgi:hypothetical protein
MNYSYQQNKKGKVVAWILATILLIAAAGAVFVVFNKKGNENSDKSATNIQKGLVMVAEPDFRLNAPIGLRSTAIITPELYKEVSEDENKNFGIVFAPLNYFLKVDIDGTGDVDWANAFEKETLTASFVESMPVAITSADGTLSHYIHKASISNIPYQGVNMQLVGIGYVRTVDGENVSYKYASFPEGLSYKDCGYSYAYAAAEKLNELKVHDLYLAQSDLDILHDIINQSVDLANGLTEPTDDGSKYAVTLSDVSKTLNIDEEFTLEVDIAEAVKTPIWWQSTDTSVVVVNNGVIKAVGEGTATINVFVAGVKHTCAITVNAVQENTK